MYIQTQTGEKIVIFAGGGKADSYKKILGNSYGLWKMCIRDRYSAGYQTVFHVHDEAVIDAPIEVSVEKACAIMGEPIKWAPGLLLRADGFEAEYYKKD